MAPQAKKSKLSKPDKTVYCPMSRQPLRVKDLIPVVWTEVRDPDNKKSMIAREERYQCAVTGDTLNNSSLRGVEAYRTRGYHGVRGEDHQEGLAAPSHRADPGREGHHPDNQGSYWV